MSAKADELIESITKRVNKDLASKMAHFEQTREEQLRRANAISQKHRHEKVNESAENARQKKRHAAFLRQLADR